MKKILLISLLVIIAGALPLSSCGGGTEEVIELSMANYLPATHPFTALQESFGTEINTRTEGRVNITYYPAGSLTKANQVPDHLTQGVVDIAFSHIGYNAGRFPVSEALDLPMGYPTGWVGSHVATDFYNEFQAEEWDDFHILLFNAGCTAGLMLRDTKVTTLEDLQGKTLRGAGEVAEAIQALGATARDIAMVEMYDAVSKGTVDGTLVGIETLKSFNMADVCKYTAFAWQVGNMYTFYLAMNKDKWDDLPGDIKDIFDEVSTEWAEKYAEMWNNIDIAGINHSLSIEGNEVYLLSDAEGARFKNAVQPVLTNYTDDMVAAGYDQDDVEEWLGFIVDRIAYWTPIEEQRGIPSPFDVNLPEG